MQPATVDPRFATLRYDTVIHLPHLTPTNLALTAASSGVARRYCGLPRLRPGHMSGWEGGDDGGWNGRRGRGRGLGRQSPRQVRGRVGGPPPTTRTGLWEGRLGRGEFRVRL
jgi:hypothetical protein